MFLHYILHAECKKQYVFYTDRGKSLSAGCMRLSADFCSCITAQGPLAVSVVALDLLFYKYTHRQ